ncbi:MAG: hypothetical protein M3N46_11780 [Actinomycetota bacterium]|nr:hypothetical protein [Actinomycetota bacterium]
MNPQDEYFSREHRYALGVDRESGRHYASIPVVSGAIDYEEFYLLVDEQYARFIADPDRALAFIEECRRREHEDLLLQKPGWNRGIPM